MGSGLIQLTSYGSQDLYLTGVPEITYFKVVYRRYTNFSIESLEVKFNNDISFGKESTIEIPKIGDLIHKIYLEIILPEINLKKKITEETKFTIEEKYNEYNIARDNYKKTLNFMKLNMDAYTRAIEYLQTENILDISGAQSLIYNIFIDNYSISKYVLGYLELTNAMIEILNDTEISRFKYEEISMLDISTNFNNYGGTDIETKQNFIEALKNGYLKSKKVQNSVRKEVLKKKEIYENLKNDNLQFAWVDRIGHAIIDYIEIYIGGQKIDKHYGDWINIWYELTANRYKEDIYMKMIGNVKELTDFNREKKPQYKIQLPLQFWFCRHNGLSIPLVALQYHDVSLNVKFKNLEEVSYIEQDKLIYISDTKEELSLNEITQDLNININASLFIDYIYLDSQERKRFAQSSHEYLIEQVQTLEYLNVNEQNIQITLNNFVHPIKEIIWRVQKYNYIINENGYTKLRWDNYSLTDNNQGNPIKYSSMNFHSYERIVKQLYSYFNYLQPYESHYTTPSDGINMYSFSLAPEDHQPSGTANFSTLSKILLNLEFDESLNLSDQNINSELLNLVVYARNYNILRIVSGQSSLAMTYG